MSREVNWEQIRHSYRPKRIRLLFVGESRPANGTFFYTGDSILHDAMADAFRPTFPDFGGVGFPAFFAELGCYLEDLCSEPVNQWKIKDRRRIAAREAGEFALSERVTGTSPATVILVMKAILPNVRRVLAAGAVRSPLIALPFPARPQHREEFVGDLSRIVGEFHRRGGFQGS